jgi:hypothetical protein
LYHGGHAFLGPQSSLTVITFTIENKGALGIYKELMTDFTVHYFHHNTYSTISAPKSTFFLLQTSFPFPF